MLQPVTKQTIDAYAEKHKGALQKPFRLSFLDNQTAVMPIEAFFKTMNGQRCMPFLRNSFRAINTKDVQNLVLDLRNNDGGEEALGVLF